MTSDRGAEKSATASKGTKTGSKSRKPAKSPPGGRSSVRSEQQRSIESRIAILEAALAEFADKGYDATSFRAIGERAGLHFTLVTYHFSTKRKLWEAAISHFFDEINESWQTEMAAMPSDDPLDRLRHQFHSFLKFSLKYPNFHRALLQENRANSPRLEWVINYFVSPIMNATFPNILKSQKDGLLAESNAVLMYYLLLGACAAMSSMSGEIMEATDLDIQDSGTIEEYWGVIDDIVFKQRDAVVQAS